MHVVDAYAAAVLAGQIIAGRYVRLACERHFAMRENAEAWGIRFNTAAADRVLRFYAMLRQSKGRHAGKPLRLVGWQMFVAGSIYGWQRLADEPGEDGAPRWVRLIRTSLEAVARKNGKSTVLAGDGLYALGWDGESAAEVYSAATTKDQAKIIFNEARRLAKRTPELRGELRIGRHDIEHEPSDSLFKPLAADHDSLDGLGPSRNLVDEMHAHKTRDLLSVLETGTGGRDQPLTRVVTTSGDSADGTSPCWELRNEMIEMLEGRLGMRDDGVPHGLDLFAFIAELDKGDDWRDEAVWPKSNPSLGVTKDIGQMREKLSRARVSPAFRHQFRVKELNEWLQGDNRLIDLGEWRKGAVPVEVDPGDTCFLGVDLSTKQDITAVVAVFPAAANGVRKWRIVPHFFCPAATIERRSTEDNVPYDDWERAGLITKTAGARIDYDVVRERILDLVDEFDVPAIGVDPWNAAGLVSDLLDAGHDVVELRMGFRTMSGPTKEFLALIADGAIEHGGHPVLDWMAENTQGRFDVNENVMPKKVSQRRRIDGVVAAIMGIALAVSGEHSDEYLDDDEKFGGV